MRINKTIMLRKVNFAKKLISVMFLAFIWFTSIVFGSQVLQEISNQEVLQSYRLVSDTLRVNLPDTPMVIPVVPVDTPVVVVQDETLPLNDGNAGSAPEGEVSSSPRDDLSRLRDELTQAPDVRNLISFGKIFWSLIFIFVGYFILKLISAILTILSDRNTRYKPSIRRLLPMINIFGWSFIVYLIINGIFQPPPETVFAFFASVGVAIGFASQDLLKNIFGGLMILFDKPFQIGDKIESGKYYGEVLEVGLRSTRVVTPDDSIVTIPNSEMMNQSISNANSSENNCQVVAEFFFPVTADTRRIRQIATEAAQISRYVYLNKPIAVEFSNVLVPKGSFLKMRLKAYVNDVRYEFPFQSEMTEIVLRETVKEGMLEGL